MILQEQAQELIASNAPISPNKESLRYQFIWHRSLGESNEDIASSLGVDLGDIEETEYDIEMEFIR